MRWISRCCSVVGGQRRPCCSVRKKDSRRARSAQSKDGSKLREMFREAFTVLGQVEELSTEAKHR